MSDYPYDYYYGQENPPTPWPQQSSRNDSTADPTTYQNQVVEREPSPAEDPFPVTWNAQAGSGYDRSREVVHENQVVDRSHSPAEQPVESPWNMQAQTANWEYGLYGADSRRSQFDRSPVNYSDTQGVGVASSDAGGSSEWKGKGIDYGVASPEASMSSEAAGSGQWRGQVMDNGTAFPGFASDSAPAEAVQTIFEGAGQYVDPPPRRPAPKSAELEAGLRDILKGRPVELVEVDRAGPSGTRDGATAQSGGEMPLSSRSSSSTVDGFAVDETRRGLAVSRIINGVRSSLAESQDRIRVAYAIGNAMEAYGRYNSLPYVTASGNALMNGYEGFEKFLETTREQYKNYESRKRVDWKAVGSTLADMAMFGANSGAGFNIANSANTNPGGPNILLDRGKFKETSNYSAAAAGAGLTSFLIRASQSAEKAAAADSPERERDRRESGDRAERGEQRIELPDRSAANVQSTNAPSDQGGDNSGRGEVRHHRHRHRTDRGTAVIKKK